MRTRAKRIKEVRQLPEHMRQWQHRHHSLTGLYRQDMQTVLHIVRQRLAANHHALGRAGGAAGVIDKRQRFGVNIIVEISRLHALRKLRLKRNGYLFVGRNGERFLCSQEREILHRKHRSQLRQVLLLQALPYIRTHKQHFRIRMPQQVRYILSLKVLQDTDNHCLIGCNSQIGYHPVCTVPTRNRNLVARLYTHLLKQHMQSLHFLRHLPKGVRLLLPIVRHRRITPLMFHYLLQVMQIVMFHTSLI